MEVILVRHGQSESNARLTTELDSNLTELGRNQAQATAEYLIDSQTLANPSTAQVYVSPFRRTLQTCEPLAQLAGIKAHAHPDICEYFSDTNESYLAFNGLTTRQIAQDYPFVDLERSLPLDCPWWPTSQENRNAIYDRAARVRDALYRQYAGSDTQVVIFSHAETMGRIIEAMQRIEPAEGYPAWNDNCGISRLIVTNRNEPADLVLLNYRDHLTALGLT